MPMKISEIMTSDVEVVTPEQPMQQAARLMLQIDAGVVPVQDGESLIGIVTDRDIAVRGVAEGRAPETPIREVMSEKPLFCFDDDEVRDVAMKMSEAQVRRFPVLSREAQKLVGIVSLGDLTRAADQGQAAAAALDGISEPGGHHNQSEQA
jgi:CBS domain-containing protein